MNYQDGVKVRVGDMLKYSDDSEGKVVCSMDDDHYSKENPREQWAHLEKGVMVESESFGLIHYPEELDSDIVFLRHQNTT